MQDVLRCNDFLLRRKTPSFQHSIVIVRSTKLSIVEQLTGTENIET
jgi:hypothetical protein